METSTVISLGALAASFIGIYLSSRKETKTDAAATAIIQTKLDALIGGVDEIRVETRSMRQDLYNHGERLAVLEARAKSNTHRLDALEGITKEREDKEG